MYIRQSSTKPIRTREEIIKDLRWQWLNPNNTLRINNGIQADNLLGIQDIVEFSENKEIIPTEKEAEENSFDIIDNKVQDTKIIPHDQIEINHHWL